MASVFCTQCGQQNPDDSKFCARCGAPLTVPSTPGVAAVEQTTTISMTSLDATEEHSDEVDEAGTTVTAGEACGEVESTKSVSEIYAPVTGEVTARNDALESRPELINSDPYGEGWLVEIATSEATAAEGLLDASAYGALTGTS